MICSLVCRAQREPYADSLLLDAQYDAVIQWADQVVSTKHDSAQWVMASTRKAEALVRLGKFDEADRLLASLAPQKRMPSQKATIDIAYGVLLLHQGLFDKADARLESALSLLESTGQQDSFEGAQALSYLGNLRRATGEYTQSEALLTRALVIRQQMYGSQSEWIAASYNDLGLVFSQTDPDQALTYYERALRIYEKLHAHTHPKIAIALTNIGFTYVALELYGDATTNFEAALKIWEAIYPNAHPTKGFLNHSLGDIYRKLKNPSTAAAYYDKALALYRKSYGEKHPDLATVYNALGSVLLEQGNHAAALDAYQHAIVSNVAGFDNLDASHAPAVRGYYNGRILLNTLLLKAQAFESRYFAHTIRMSDLEQSRNALMACDTLVDLLRQQISNESDKIALGSIAAQVYQSGVRVCVEAADVAFRKTGWYERAFYFAEKGKSAVLLEGISEMKAKAFARIPAPLLDEERELRAALALATTQLAQKPSPDEEKGIRERLFSLGRQYGQFVNRLEHDFPQYYNLKYNKAAPTVKEVQQRLDSHTAVVSYQIDEANKGLYIFMITRTRYRVHQRPLPADMERNITGLRNGLAFNASGPYHLAATHLSDVLLPDIPKKITDLVIVPTGRLSVVPFETLFTRRLKEGQEPSYLIGQYSIRYELAASLILQKSPQAGAHKAILLCAPVTFEDGELPALPGTAAEVTAIDSLFANSKFERTILMEGQAQEEVLRAQHLNQFQYVHFATHGVVDENRPELSRIYMHRGKADDGILYAGEIYNLELDAELVTLSACQTGLGKIAGGEGVIGLSRALAYAGARRMMVSFWQVADASTSLLMQDFYQSLLRGNGQNPGQHLRTAKLKMIKSGKYASPHYWAPFVLIGF